MAHQDRRPGASDRTVRAYTRAPGAGAATVSDERNLAASSFVNATFHVQVRIRGDERCGYDRTAFCTREKY